MLTEGEILTLKLPEEEGLSEDDWLAEGLDEGETDEDCVSEDEELSLDDTVTLIESDALPVKLSDALSLELKEMDDEVVSDADTVLDDVRDSEILVDEDTDELGVTVELDVSLREIDEELERDMEAE